MANKKKISIIAGATGAAVLAIAGGAFALFTDNSEKATTGTAGTVELEASDLALSNFENINPGDNDPDLPKEYTPTEGDPQFDPENPDKTVPVHTTPHDLTFTIKNNGTKSIRTRHTLVVSVKDVDGNPLDARVFQLYEGESELTGKVYITADGEEITDVANIPEGTLIKSIRYRFTPDIFDGVGKAAESEDVSTVKGDGETPASKDYLYRLAMDMETPNSYQGAQLDIEAIFEALQFRNTTKADWEIVSTKVFSAEVAGSSTSAAPDRNTD